MTDEVGALVLLGVIVRVALVIVVWLALFLIVFLGYLTIPIVIVSLFLVAYTMIDLRRVFVRLRRNRRAARKP